MRPGDFARGLPLFAYHFLVITCYMMARVARDAIFLDHFRATALPGADIASAVLAGVVVAVYIRLGRATSLRALQQASIAGIVLSLVAIWWGLHDQDRSPLAAVLYVWIGICGPLLVTQVWTLANVVWTTREAKRLFAMLGSGGIAGGIVGGFLAQAIARTWGTDAMLLAMSAALVPCLWLISATWRQRPLPTTAAGGDARSEPRGLRQSLRLVRESPHLRTIALLICLASMATTTVGWQLKAMANDALHDKDALAAYLGLLTGVTGLVALAVQLAVTAPLLRRFGVGVALLVLPVALLGGSLAVALTGSLWAVTIMRGTDSVFRYSVDSSAMQLLYLPVPLNIKLQTKSFLDTVIWKFGDGLAGLALLVFATVLGFSPRAISVITLTLLLAWIAAAVVARRRYVATLRDNIHQARLKPDEGSLPTVDYFTTELFAEKLRSPEQTDVLYALNLFEIGQQLQSHGAIRALITHRSPIVRKRAIAILSASGDRSVIEAVRARLRDEVLDVRTEALRYLIRHDDLDPLTMVDELGDFGDAAIRSATVVVLARPGEGQDIETARLILDRMVRETGEAGRATRLDAAELMAMLPAEFDEQLAVLLSDEDATIREEAIRTAGQLRRARFVSILVDSLGDDRFAAEAALALARMGDVAAEALGHRLDDRDATIALRHAIPAVLLKIGTPQAAKALAENLLQSDLALRSKVISALNKLHMVRHEITIDRPLIETSMIAELMGHYRSYQLLGRGDAPAAGLNAAMAGEMERIFRLLKLLYPSIDLEAAYLGVQSNDPSMHANALEFLDHTLTPRVRALLVPLVDSDVTVAERIRLSDKFLGFTLSGNH